MTDRSLARNDAGKWGQLLDSWRPYPALLIDRYLDVVAATDTAADLSGAFRVGQNLARFAFLSPQRQTSHPRWREAAAATAGLLRAFVDEHDADRASQRFLGELSIGSREFSELWADSRTPTRMTGRIVFEMADAGELHFAYSILGLKNHDDLAVLVFTPSDADSEAAVERRAESSSAPR
ncbi:hypothetical protein GCM10027058_08270 [Microbacterium neimengense]